MPSIGNTSSLPSFVGIRGTTFMKNKPLKAAAKKSIPKVGKKAAKRKSY